MDSDKRYLMTKVQQIRLENTYTGAKILDIGGGGEGIIGKLYGSSVVAIDKRLDELEETDNESLKIVMDACELKFLDKTFDVVTAFYSLMYMNSETQLKVMNEAYRVLKDRGVFEICDINIPKYDGGDQDIFVAKIEVEVQSEKIETGYGVKLNDKGQSSNDIKLLMGQCNFELIEEETIGESFRLRFVKK